MRSLTRVGLPILLVAGVVFGITFIQMYSSDDAQTEGTEDVKPTVPGTPRVTPLFFGSLKATPVPIPPSGDVMDVSPLVRHMYYWDAHVEVSAPGHYEFWCHNRNKEPISIRVPSTNCQCAAVEMAVVPPDALRDYIVGSALAGSPLCSAPSPLAAITHVLFDRQLNWELLNGGEEKHERTVPAADPVKGPQFALVRLGWTGKGDPGPKTVFANLYANLPNATPSHTLLEATTMVVPAFDVMYRDGRKFEALKDISLGDLQENGQASIEIFLASPTRSTMLYQTGMPGTHPCVTVEPVVPATAQEIAEFQQLSNEGGANITRLRSLYKTRLTVKERTVVEKDGKKELHMLDLGVLDTRLFIKAVEGGGRQYPVRARVVGEFQVVGGADNGRINFGNSVPSDLDNTRDVILLAERPGFDLKLVESETTPSFLKVRLEEQAPVDGRKQWRLRVTIPKNNLYGSLPENSRIVLQTNAATPRRVSIPVRGISFDTGGPRL